MLSNGRRAKQYEQEVRMYRAKQALRTALEDDQWVDGSTWLKAIGSTDLFSRCNNGKLSMISVFVTS